MMRNLALPSRRARTSCSVLALATAMLVGPSPAAAQSFLGSGAFATNGGGVAGITTPTSTTTTITVNPGQSVIDWIPTDNAIGGGNIAFQLSGTTATFTGASNFAVLNRINQADMNRAISLNGTINSLVNGQQGGSLYFYSPGGFLLGGNSIINVGSLVLSASPLTLDGSGNFINGTSVTFGQAPRATAGIVTSTGSTINANAGDAYVALVAPRVQHGGSITVNGSAALVAAEAATINFSPSGLFDIQVSAGTTDATGVSTTGTITGAASTGAGDIHRAYLVAVPKNSALTMLIGAGSNLGFDVAGAADVVGNTVILSAGHDIYAGGIGAPSSGTTGGAVANIQVNDSNFSSALIGEATGYAHLAAFNPMHFYSDATIHAEGDIWFSTQAAAGTIDVTGNLNLSTERYANYQQSLTTSAIELFNVGGGGRITVNGATNLNSISHAGLSFTDNIPGGNATGGLIRVRANDGGAINLLGGLSANASAYGGSGSAVGANGGNATGGLVRILTSGSNSALTINGGATLTSNAYGGSGNGGECFICNGNGGNGQGGSIWVSSQNAAGSSLSITGNLSADASGFGGFASDPAATPGSGHGGEANFYTGTGSSLSVAGNVLLRAEGSGGYNPSGNGGAGTGGSATISEAAGATSGTVLVNGNVELSTDGHGGSAGGIDGIGGNGTGGANSYIFADNASITINGDANVHAIGYGGDAGYGTAGNATGGAAYIQSRNAITISGGVSLGANAYGGDGAVGGNADGGDVFLIADSGGSLNLTGNVYNMLSASAYAGDSNNGNGGTASGGSIAAYAVNASSTLNVAGNLGVYSEGHGGVGQGPGTGGDGIGGDVSVYTNSGATLSLANLNVSADGFGGSGNDGGLGQGGAVSISSQSAMTVGGSTYATARGYGGDIGSPQLQGQASVLIGGVAGDGFGGDIDIYAQNGTLVLGGSVTINTNGLGGSAGGTGDTAGDGFGGQSRLFANIGGTVNLQSSLNSTAIGRGGYEEYSGIIGGSGFGGDVRVQATDANAHVSVAGFSSLDASGRASTPGGECYYCGGTGGDGFGGTVWVDAFGAPTASLAFGSSLFMLANGYGGDGTRAAGGFAQGGEVLLQASAGSHVSVAGDATLRTDAYGGYSYDYSYNFNATTPVANGGDAVGGTSRIQTFPGTGTGGIISIDGSAYVYARGYGGEAAGNNVGIGGDGTGGSSQVIGTGGSITIGDPELGYGNLTMAATGTGGNAVGGTGGDGYGGLFVAIDAINGDVSILGHADLDSSGTGGNGYYGGDGFASGQVSDPDPLNWTGGAHIFAKHGSINIGNGASVHDNASGGDGGYSNGYTPDYGGDGGNAVGGWAEIFAANSALGASTINIVSSNGGSGVGLVEANAYGGNGGIGASGSFGGYGVDGGYGTVGTDGTNGGNATPGGAGGFGGSATGGIAGIYAASDNGHVTVDYASGSAIAVGGDGGNGGYGGYGGSGGNGGVGTVLTGGNGGNGGTGGDGGVGGAGGSATGGGVTIGTLSGNNEAIGLGLGTANFLTATLDASATGGDGGNGGGAGFGGFGGGGGAGFTANGLDGIQGADGAPGNGGNGGDAQDGATVFIVRGSTVNVDTVTMHADATGGDGGLGYDAGYGTFGIDGNGGNAIVGNGGGIHVVASSRYQLDSQRGTLNAGSINGTAIATGGAGDYYGNSETYGGSGVDFRNADGTIGSLDFLIQADSAVGPLADVVSVVNGDVSVDQGFSFITSGNLSLFLDGGDLTADTITVHAYDFVPDAAHGTPTILAGTFYARLFDIATTNNFLTTANLDSIEALTIFAPGSIYVANINVDSSADLEAVNGEVIIGDLFANGDVDIDAALDIQTGNIDGNGLMDLFAGGSIFTGTIDNIGDTSLDAGGSINIGALDSGNGAASLIAGQYISGSTVNAGSIYTNSGSSTFLTDLTAIGDIEMIAASDILIGNAISGETIDIDAGGYIDGGSITAGDAVEVKAGTSVNFADVSAGLINPSTSNLAGYNVGIEAGTTINTGNISAARNIGLAAGGDILTGNVDAALGFLGLSGGNMTFGSIDAGGIIYLGDVSMYALGGDFETGFDAAPIVTQQPFRSGGSIAINGPVTTGAFYAGAGSSFDAGDITSGHSIYVDAGTDIAVGNLVAGLSDNTVDSRAIRLNSDGSIDLGNAIAIGRIKLSAVGTIDGGNLTSGDMVSAEADGAIVLGNISSGLVSPQPPTPGDVSVGILSKTSIEVGNIDSAGTVGMVTLGALDAGHINATGDLIALAGGNMTLGALNIAGRALLSDPSLYINAQDINGDVNPEDILTAPVVPSGGSISITGPVTAGSFRASAGSTFNAGNITALNNIIVDSGGNMTLGNLSAGVSVDANVPDAIRLISGGSILLGNAIALDGFDFDAVGNISGGNITSGRIVSGNAGGSIAFGNLSGGLINPQGPSDKGFSVGMVAGGSLAVGNVSGAESVGLGAVGTLSAGTVNAGINFLALAGGNMNLGAITAGSRVYLADKSMFLAAGGVIGGGGNFDPALVYAVAPVATGGSITTGAINAGSVQAAAGTTMNVGAINASGLVDLSSGGAMQTQNITSGGSLRLTSGGSITGGNYIANTLVRVFGAGAVNVGNISIVHPSLGAKPIGTAAVSLIPTGSPIEVFGSSIVTGNLLTDGYVGLYTPGTMSVGTIGAATDVIALAGGNASFGAITTPGRFILGGYSMFAGLGSGASFNPSLVFGLTKAKTGGSATFGGASSVGSFQAYVGGAATLQSLTTSSSALIDALGLFTLNGILNGNSRVISDDIDIGSGGAVNTGTLQLVSRNATQTVVGDGVAGGGYQLSDAEFDRIHTPLSVVADVSYGAAAKMLIGDLTATVSGTSLSGYDYLFATLNGTSSTSVGSIKVLGDVTFTGLSLTDEVAFQTNLFELDAATGSVNLFGSGTTLGGVLGLYAPKVWVASGDILTKLEANARYTGYIADLNAPAAVQRPEGVLRAASFDIDAGSEAIQSLLVQNTGTKAIPAGFLLTDLNISSSDAPAAAPGSIDLVINGQVITLSGTATGIAVRDGLVTEFGIVPFTSTSTINGCALVGACTSNPTPPKITILEPTDLQLVDNGGLGDGLFGNEPDIDDGRTGDEGDLSSPIEPPIPLFDSRPLDQSDDVNDPASGAGNPSLYGDPEGDGDSDEQKKAKKATKGDGK